MRKRAEVFHVAEFIQEEMTARGWDLYELAKQMGGDEEEIHINHVSLSVLFAMHPDIVVGEPTAGKLARAFGTSKEIWMNLDKSWHEWIRWKKASPA